tara:strand:+ start:894 stop:1928 length:1035 start_codon:yes stop_codon:yes gene_type:complete
MELITSNKFASLSDVIFSEVVSKADFDFKNQRNNLSIIQKSNVNNSEFIWYINNEFEIKDGDIVYCQTEVLKRFFNIIENLKLKNITLITNQSDISIDRKLYSKKPKTISKWFAINVVTNQKDLIPIPLGVNNDYMDKHPTQNDFKNLRNNFSQKKNQIYLNFNINTRFLHRFHTKNQFRNKKNAVIEHHILSKKDYLEEINKYKFIVCPWGNGYDTHRFWEAIYSFSIPISLKHISNETFDSLPILRIQTFRNLELDFEKFSNTNFNLEGSIADFSYWENKIVSQVLTNYDVSSYKVEIYKDNSKFLSKFMFFRIFLNRYKHVKYFIFRIYKKIYNLVTLSFT